MGLVLTKLRKQKGFDQAEISERCGINRSSWSRMEMGKLSPNFLQIEKIEQELGLEPGQFQAKVAQSCQRLQEEEGVKIADGETKSTSKAVFFGAALAALVAGMGLAALASDDTSEEE